MLLPILSHCPKDSSHEPIPLFCHKHPPGKTKTNTQRNQHSWNEKNRTNELIKLIYDGDLISIFILTPTVYTLWMSDKEKDLLQEAKD